MGKIYGCFRAEPVKKGAPKGNLKKHCTATKEYAEDQQAKQIKAYGYSYIEPENVKYNRVLVDCPETYDEKIKECQTEKFGGRTIRRDGIPMLDTIFYYSPEKTKNLLCYFHRKNTHWKQENAEWWEAYESMSKEERLEKINEEYKWVKSWAQASEKWAEENLGQVVHCVLHCHEGTPHLDCKTLAIKEKEKDKWIWAKREILGNKAHLSMIQTKYAEECGAKFGLERGEIKQTGELRKHSETERHMAAEARKQDEAIMAANENHIRMQDKQIEANQATLDRFKENLTEWVQENNSLQRILRTIKRLSEAHRDKIETRFDATAKRGAKAISGASGSLESLLAAERELEQGTRIFQVLKAAAEEDRDPDELLADDDFGR